MASTPRFCRLRRNRGGILSPAAMAGAQAETLCTACPLGNLPIPTLRAAGCVVGGGIRFVAAAAQDASAARATLGRRRVPLRFSNSADCAAGQQARLRRRRRSGGAPDACWLPEKLACGDATVCARDLLTDRSCGVAARRFAGRASSSYCGGSPAGCRRRANDASAANRSACQLSSRRQYGH